METVIDGVEVEIIAEVVGDAVEYVETEKMEVTSVVDSSVDVGVDGVNIVEDDMGVFV